jgi:hypothetical protein
MSGLGQIAPRESAAPVLAASFAVETDIVVVGGGAAGCQQRCSRAG